MQDAPVPAVERALLDVPFEPATAADPADAFERAIRADAARRRAQWLAGATIEAIASAPGAKRRRPRKTKKADPEQAGPIDPAKDWSFAYGCGPAPEAFGETHCGFTPVETTLARRVARARRDLHGFADACDAGRVPADCIESLATVATPGTIALWLVMAANDPNECRAMLRVAEVGESPDVVNGADAQIAWGLASGGRFRCARTLRLSPVQQRDIWRARFLLSRKLKETISVGDAFAELVRRLDAELRRRRGRRLTSVDDLRPGRVVLTDGERRVPWIQTNRGRFQLRWRDLPRRRKHRRANGQHRWRNVRAIALAPSGAPLEATQHALGAAYPTLVTADLASLPHATGAVAEGASRLSTLDSRLRELERLAGPDPERALAALDPSARTLPADWNPEHHRAGAAAAGRLANAERCEIILAVAEVADEIAAGARPDEHADRLRHALGWKLRDWKDAVQLGRQLRGQPALCAAFRAGASYARVRAIARRPQPGHDDAWAHVAGRFPTELVEALVAVAEPGAKPPETPPGYEPIRPAGSTIAEHCFVTFSKHDTHALERVQAAIEKVVGATLGPESLVAAVAGLWLRWFDAEVATDLVIYLPSPESRLAAPAERLAPRLQRIAPGEARLHAAFGYLRRLQADRRLALTSDSPAPPPGGKLNKTARDISMQIRRAVVARDGERCITPGCGRDLTTEHDHNRAVEDGGWPDARYDRRLCKACNLAKAAGRLRVVSFDDGSTIVADAWFRVVGSVELGVNWDVPLAAWVASSAAPVAAARLGGARPYGSHTPAAGASVVRESRSIWTTREGAAGGSPRGDPVAVAPVG